ncbi:hypothetical protein [Streptomyces griseus]|uniref:hypothetical protein n=1 Tax=Streptomyces griseus TaxID=1911 RepID=UPI000564F666|nr:hypothetical protein [Streptomyces griseus]
MSTPPAPLRMVEAPGPEALWLLDGGSLGRLVYMQRDQAVLRPGRHTWEGMGGAPNRRTLADWIHGPYDTLLRLHPTTLAGFRLTRGDA